MVSFEVYWFLNWRGSVSFANINHYTSVFILCTTDSPTSTMITMLPLNITVLRDAAVSIKCTTDANPDAHIYHFFLNDNLIGNSSSGVFNTTVMADGVYTCVPINTDGTGDNATVSITAVGKCKHTSCPLFKDTICKMLYS